jgi:16S rRNA (guanine966-N2)-methyltransferase
MKKKRPGTVRIIGGKWRGRRLAIADLPGLRPSGDRGREVLFNWLQMNIRGARCLDLFAGTGVLGLEAASRGASGVVLVEKSAVAARAIQENIALLDADEVSLATMDALEWLVSCDPASADIVFIDPPFDSGLETRTMELLDERGCVRPGGLVYVETARSSLPLNPGPGWEIAKEKTLGEVRMLLLKKS